MQRMFAPIVLCIIFLITGCFSTLPNIELEPITESTGAGAVAGADT